VTTLSNRYGARQVRNLSPLRPPSFEPCTGCVWYLLLGSEKGGGECQFHWLTRHDGDDPKQKNAGF
jgi:hypothetical protein